MPPALSVDLKRRIVDLRHEELTMRDIAAQMKVSVGCVHKTLRTYEGCGNYMDPSKRRTGRPHILDDDEAWYLKSLLESNPTLYLDEIKHKLEVVRNVSVLMATISRFLRSKDFTWKAVSRKALEGDRMVWAYWEVETAQYVDPDCFVFIDESHLTKKLVSVDTAGHRLDCHWSSDLRFSRVSVTRYCQHRVPMASLPSIYSKDP